MRRWETFTSLAAVILATIGSIPTSYRYVFIALAVVLISFVGISQLRRAFTRPEPSGEFDPGERAREIRERRRHR